MGDTTGLSDLQLSIMRILWDLGEATVAEVRSALSRELAPTTIATVLSRLEKRNLVSHRSEGRQYVYSAAVSDGEVLTSDVEELTRRWFRGDASLLVSHLLGGDGIDSEDLDRMRALIEEHEQNEGRRGE